MISTKVKQKGHKYDEAEYHIAFYTDRFFNKGEREDENEKKVKIPTLINVNEEDTRSNTTNIYVNEIEYFDHNIEDTLNTMEVIHKRVLKPKKLDENEEVKQFMQLLRLCCASTASTTLENVAKEARRMLYDDKFSTNEIIAVFEEEIIEDETHLYTTLEAGNWADPESERTIEEQRAFLYKEYKRHVLNGLYQIMFGAEAYRAFLRQKDYLKNKIVKPYGITVESAFRRVDVLVNLMKYFPPPGSRGKQADIHQWNSMEDAINNHLNEDEVRTIKFNLLPDRYRTKIDSLEQDWMDMTFSKFLLESQKCEALEQVRNAKKTDKDKEKNKRKREQDKLKDQANKRNKNGHTKDKEMNRPGNDRKYCALCKLAGAPQMVYNSHNMEDCNKKRDYKKLLGGSRGKARDKEKERREREEYRALEKRTRALEKGYKKLKAKKSPKEDDEDDISMASDQSF